MCSVVYIKNLLLFLRYYSEVKQCALNMTTTMCTPLDSKMKRDLRFAYGSFNPYCKDGRDPPKTEHPQETDQGKNTPKTNYAVAHQLSGLMPVLVVLVRYMEVYKR